VRQLLLALALMAGVTTIAARAGRDLRGPRWVRARRVLLPGAFAATLACVFVVPTITAARLASAGASDSGLPGVRSPSELAALTSYLKAHQGRAKYELAVYPAALAGPVIVHDDRPVLVLGTIKRQLLVTADQLAAAVRAGEVRYALLKPVPGARCNATGTPAPAVGGKPRADTSAVRWARMHGADVSRQAGLDACGQLYHLTRGAAHS
ncbi:MAG TPA: hypothetical protein VHE14_05505, partial [Solirubrobacteraceae bacterium]|nr:hypothetical protein [Solirubrobacteraceae bacterium]